MASGKLSFISMSEQLLQAARLRAAASERVCFIPVPKPEYYSLRQGEEESERGRQREERGRRQGGGSRERGGSAQREAGEAPASAVRARPGRRRPSAGPPSAQPGRCGRVARSGRGRARIVSSGGGPPGPRPRSERAGAEPRARSAGHREQGRGARAGARCGQVGVGRSVSEAGSGFTFSRL